MGGVKMHRTPLHWRQFTLAAVSFVVPETDDHPQLGNPHVFPIVLAPNGVILTIVSALKRCQVCTGHLGLCWRPFVMCALMLVLLTDMMVVGDWSACSWDPLSECGTMTFSDWLVPRLFGAVERCLCNSSRPTSLIGLPGAFFHSLPGAFFSQHLLVNECFIAFHDDLEVLKMINIFWLYRYLNVEHGMGFKDCRIPFVIASTI